MVYEVGDKVQLRLDEPYNWISYVDEYKSDYTLRDYLKIDCGLSDEQINKEYFVITGTRKSLLDFYILEGIDEVHFIDEDLKPYVSNNKLFIFKE